MTSGGPAEYSPWLGQGALRLFRSPRVQNSFQALNADLNVEPLPVQAARIASWLSSDELHSASLAKMTR